MHFAGLLAAHGVRAWADTGTLLGLLREGDVLRHDGDLDFSLYESDYPALAALGRRVEGHRVEVWRWRGLPFKVKWRPLREPGARVVDFKIYRRIGDRAWCPQAYDRTPRNPILLRIVWRARALYFRSRTTRDVDGPLGRTLFGLNTWWIPAELFAELESFGDSPILVPRRAEDLLRLHYGDWRVPRVAWKTLTDDGAILRRRPRDVVGR